MLESSYSFLKYFTFLILALHLFSSSVRSVVFSGQIEIP